MKRFALLLPLVTFLMLITGCGGEPTSESPPMLEVAMPEAAHMADRIEQARADLAQRLNLNPGEIEVVSAAAVTWSNSALGCPEPDMMYTQALVPGYRIVLSAQAGQHHYHGADGKPPFLCPAARVKPPVPASGAD